MIKEKKSILLITAAATALSGCLSRPLPPPTAGDPAELARYVEERVERFRQETNLTGLSVAVVARGETVAAFGKGWADKEGERPLDGATPMPVGSVSKLFTSLAVVQLSRRGLLDLNAPIGTYLPELHLAEEAENRITLAQILSHHGGLPGDFLEGWHLEDPGLDAMRALPAALKGTPLISEPGTHFAYSNLGFSLLGSVVERVGGKPYDRYIREEIFAPAGMANGRVFPEPGDPALPTGYGIGQPAPPPMIRDIAAGSLLLSAEDAAAFIEALYPPPGRPGLVDEAGLLAMLTRQNTGVPLDRDFSIGLGFWLIDPLGLGVPLASHGGDLPPFNTLLLTLPEQRAGIFVASNDFGKDGNGAMALGIELAKDLARWLQIETTNPTPAAERPWRPEEAALWEGTYSTMMGTMEVKKKRGGAVLSLGGKTLHLVPREDESFGLQIRFMGIPLPIAALDSLKIELFTHGGEPWLALWQNGLFGGSYRRIPQAVYPPSFADYQGSYDSEDPFVRKTLGPVTITERNGRYYLGVTFFNRPMSFPLRSVGEGKAVTDGQGRGLGERLLFKEKAQTLTLTWSGMELIKNSD